MSVCGIRLNMTSCAGVNATICISSVRESTSKRSAFDFTHCNRLCRWRHLLMLSEVILKAHAAHRHSRNLSFLYIIYHKYHFCQAGFTYVQSWATMYLYILLIGGIISIMKKQFLKGLLIKITSAVSATVLVFSAFAADTQAAAYNKVYSETDTTSTEAVWPDAPDVNSSSCILIDADTGSILFERNSHENVIQPAQPRF